MATLKIKVPIYISSPLEDPVDSHPGMCQRLEELISAYNDRRPEDKLSVTQRTKLKQKVIKYIHTDKYTFDVEDENTPALLLRIEEYKKNNKDLYIESPTATAARDITPEDKIGSNFNYVLLYPLLRYNGNDIENRWVAFVYNDPSKEDIDIRTTIYSVLSKILGLSVKMVIREATKRRLAITPSFPKVTASYVLVNNFPNDRVELTEYQESCKTTRKRVFKNLPRESFELLKNEQQPDDVLSMKITAQFNKNETVKMTYERNEEQVLMQTLMEETNGYEISLVPEDIATMHQPAKVKHYLREIITRFLSNEAPNRDE